MNILYVGDVMGEAGMRVVERLLPDLRQKYAVDLVLAQAENVTDGRGVSVDDFARLQAAGVDFCTGGNWTLHLPEIYPALNSPDEPIVRPANYPAGTPGLGYKIVKTGKGPVLVISLLGHIVGKDADKPTDNPLHVIDQILRDESSNTYAATIINFHGDYSSEKRIIGYYLDGRVTAVIGDHWHVPTADAMILPKGTAHITDVGMCGSLDSSLGVSLDSVVPRWRDGHVTRNALELEGRMQLSALLVNVDEHTGKATSVKHMYEIFE